MDGLYNNVVHKRTQRTRFVDTVAQEIHRLVMGLDLVPILPVSRKKTQTLCEYLQVGI